MSTSELFLELERANNDTDRTWILTYAFLKHLPAKLELAALVVAIPHWYHPKVIAKLLECSDDIAEKLFLQLQELPFTEPFGKLGWTLHEATRKSILQFWIKNQSEQFKSYTKLSYEHFRLRDNNQDRVESLYHLFVFDPLQGMTAFRRLVEEFRETLDYAAANNCFRNMNELATLELLGNQESAEVKQQMYRFANLLVNSAKAEPESERIQEYLIQALSLLKSLDTNRTNKLSRTELQVETDAAKREFATHQLAEARLVGDITRQHSWLVELGEVNRVEGQYEVAIAIYNEAILLVPNNQEAISNRGEIYRQMERYEEAIADFSRAIEIAPGYIYAIGSRGHTYRQMAKYEEAIADLNRALELYPNHHWLLAARGETYRLMHKSEEAIADFSQAIEIAPGYIYAIGSRGQTYRQIERYEEAIADFCRALQFDSDNDWIIAERGETYRLMRKYEEAIADFSRAIEIDPDYIYAIGSRGQTYRQIERYEEAIADFDRALQLDPKRHWIIAERGQTYGEINQYEDAVSDFTRAIELFPNDASFIALRGHMHQQTEQFEDALIDFNRAIELDPMLAWAIGSRGETYRYMGRYEEALVDLNRAIELNPNYAGAIGSRGVTYRHMGRYEEALVDLNRAIELNPNYAWAIGSRGVTYRQMGRYEEALVDLNWAVELEPNNAFAIGSRSEVLLFLNDFKTALVDAEAYVRHRPSSDWAYYLRGLCRQMNGNSSEAIGDFREAYSVATKQVLSSDSVKALNQGLFLLASADTESAITYFRTVLAQSPSVVALSAGLSDLSLYIRLFPENETATLLHRELQNALHAIKVAE